MTETHTITVCDECRPGIHNADWTHLDMNDQEESDRLYALISANLERYGWLVEAGEADMPGYFACDLCWETQCGGGYTFTS